jgi:AsmA protein
MARNARRLIIWIGGGVLGLALLLVLAVIALVWFVDPNAWRARIAQSAGNSLGRQVQLGGDLHWDIGWNIAIASEGGSIANAPGFDATPFAQWQRLRFGLNARSLLGRRIVIDQLAIDGLRVNLQRNAARAGNWNFTQAGAQSSTANASKPIVLQVASIQLRNSQLWFSDAGNLAAAGTARTWQLGNLALDVKLPPDLKAPSRELRDVALRGQLSGGPLPAAGVAVAFEAASVRHDATTATLEVPAYIAHWGDAQLSGDVHAAVGAPVTAQGRAALRVPSVRSLLATFDITPPPMADPKTLGNLDIDARLNFREPTLAVTELQIALDDTRLAGTVSVAQFRPLALRFDLEGDSIDFDRYLEPADYKGKPFELPLAQLKALNMQGVLQMASATVMGAKATELRINVE